MIANLFAFAFLCVPVRAAEPSTVLDKAASAEMQRAVKELKEPGYPEIYFLGLNVWDFEDWDRWSSLGAPRTESTMAQRWAMADLRVGGHELDNHSVTPRTDSQGLAIAIDPDDLSLRRSFWRLFDGSYKTAVADFLRKQAQVVSKGRAEYDTDDLTKENFTVLRGTRPVNPWDFARLRLLEAALAEPFRAAKGVLYADSHVGLRRSWGRRRDTDGTSVDQENDFAKIEIEAAGLTSDGMREIVERDWSALTPAALPSEDELRRAGKELVRELADLRVAESTSPFSAPALLDPSAASALVYSLGQRLTGEEQRNPAGAQTFRGRVGARVFHDSLTLVDDPTLESFNGKPLFGHYGFDDEGIAAQKVVLVENGILRGFLLSRYPVKEFMHSNGHGRAAVGQMVTGSPGNLILTGAQPRSEAELLKLLRAECRRRGRAYGLWISGLRSVIQQQGGGSAGSIRMISQVHLVDAATGKKILVRDLDLVGTPLVMAESVIAAGADSAANDFQGGTPISVIAPSLLLSDVELQRSETKPEKPPILAPPTN